MRIVTLILSVLISYSAIAEDHFLRVTDYDPIRHRATFIMLDQSGITSGTSLRVHTKMGTCMVEILDIVNESLITNTNDCTDQIIKTGLRLSYSMDDFNENNWPQDDQPAVSDNRSRFDFQDNSFMEAIRDRLSVHLGYNFASQAEGKVYADGRVKDLEGDSTLAFGILGRIYNFNPFIGLTVGLGHEFARNFDRATIIQNNAETVRGIGTRPRISLWSLSAQIEAEVIPKLNVFGGFNYSLPSIKNTPDSWDLDGDIGFQAGAGYEVYPQVDIEGLIKMTNMNLQNEFGETTDVSLTGLEVRGRYTF